MSLPELAHIELDVPGPFAIHNMPCAVCLTNHAVYFLNDGVFMPCWRCQEEGWMLKRKTRWWPW